MTISAWLKILRSDPFFERFVKESGVIRFYPGRHGRGESNRKVKTAVQNLRTGSSRLALNQHLSEHHGMDPALWSPHGLNDALICWFAENWERWMAGDWHD